MALSQRSASTETTAPLPDLHLLPKPERPSLFCPERTAAICALIETEGISDSAAGALNGVTACTLGRWKQEHEGFALVLEMARAQFERDLVRAIRETRKRDGTPDWRAKAWLLKNLSPEGCGPVSRRRKVKTAQEQEKAVVSEKCANLPETPGADAQEQQPAGPRLSRRERRAEERRLAKAERVDA